MNSTSRSYSTTEADRTPVGGRNPAILLKDVREGVMRKGTERERERGGEGGGAGTERRGGGERGRDTGWRWPRFDDSG